MAMENQVNIRAIVTIAATSVLLLLVVIIGAEAWFMSQEQSEVAAKSANAPAMSLVNLRLDQQMKISGYRWVDQRKQIVAIPIDQAMQIMVDTRGNFPTTQPQQPSR